MFCTFVCIVLADQGDGAAAQRMQAVCVAALGEAAIC